MKRKYIIIVIVLAVIGVLAVAFLQLRKMARIADIISDEAEWDVLDSLAASRTKEGALQDGPATGLSDEEDNCSIRDTFIVSKTADGDNIIESGE